jgi:acyl carrier protein
VLTGSYSDEAIFRTLRAILHAALRVGEERIVADARIFDDLGAESIDILDIRFRIEEAFGLRIQDGEILRSIDPDLAPEELRARFTVGSIAAFLRGRLAPEDGGDA